MSSGTRKTSMQTEKVLDLEKVSVKTGQTDDPQVFFGYLTSDEITALDAYLVSNERQQTEITFIVSPRRNISMPYACVPNLFDKALISKYH